MAMIPNRTQRERQVTIAKSQDNQPLKQTVAPCPTKSSSQQHPATTAHKPAAAEPTHDQDIKQTKTTIDLTHKPKLPEAAEPKKHPAAESDSND